MNKNSCFFLFIFVVSVPFMQIVTGQQKDFQFWPSASLELEVIRNLKLQVDEEVRFRENCTQMSRQINEIGMSYRFNNYLKTALTYRIEANWRNPDYYEWRTGLYADVALRYETGRFLLGYRLRMHSSKISLNEKQLKWFDGFLHRHRITLEYNMKGFPLNPFAEGEIFAVQGGSQGSSVLTYRIWAGIVYTPDKMHAFELKYGIDQELNVPDPLRSYIISLDYTIKLQMKSVQ